MELIERPMYLKKLEAYTGKDIIRVITGVRRCGKSSVLLMYMDYLKKTYGEDSAVYLRFDSPEFILERSLKAMTERLKQALRDETRFILLDEVQLIEGWQKVVNAYFSTGKYEITITGSNAEMLSGELATLLTGRYMELEILPLSFAEYMAFRNDDSSSQDEEFENYITYGGFPIIALLDEPEQKRDILQAIFDSILFNDVKTSAGSPSSDETLIRLAAFLNDAVGFPVSMNSLVNKIKAAGYKMYYELIMKYLSAFKSSFLYYSAEFHAIKGKARFGQSEKYYPVDTGLIALTKGNLSENYGSVLETAVFLELKRRGYKISVGRNEQKGSEVDFIAVKGREKAYFQVTASLMENTTREREFNALREIDDNWPKYILSMDRHDFSAEGIIHRYIPDFLLEC